MFKTIRQLLAIRLSRHPYYLTPANGLSPDGKRWSPGMIRTSVRRTVICPLQAIGEYDNTKINIPILKAADSATPTLLRRLLLWATRYPVDAPSIN